MLASNESSSAASGPLLSPDLPPPTADDANPVDPSALCEELATSHFGLYGIVSSGFYVPAEAFSDRRAFHPASRPNTDAAASAASAEADDTLPSGLELAVSTRSAGCPTTVLLHPIPRDAIALLAGFLPLTLGLPALLPLHSLAADATAKHFLVATPYGRGSLREMLAEWALVAASKKESLNDLPIRPTQRLVLTWSLDLLRLVLAWQARLDLATLGEPVQAFLSHRVLPLAPEHCYIHPASLHLQLDVVTLLMEDGATKEDDNAFAVNAQLAVEMVKRVIEACYDWKSSAIQTQVKRVVHQLASKVAEASAGEVEDALGEAVKQLDQVSRA